MDEEAIETVARSRTPIFIHICYEATARIDLEEQYNAEALLLKKRPTFVYSDHTLDLKKQTNCLEVNECFVIDDGAAPATRLRLIPPSPHIHCRIETGWVIVGSHLYEIGGRGSTRASMFHFSNLIRRLDCNKIEAGWESEELPIYCANPVTAVYGELIYMFPGGPSFTEIGEHANLGAPPCPWAYVYDTSKHNGYHLNLPPNCRRSSPSLCASVEGGVIVSIVGDDDMMNLYMHKADEKIWEKIDCDEKTPLSDFYDRPYTVSKGILYVYNRGLFVLTAYKVSPWRFLGLINLPKLDNFDIEEDTHPFIVPVDDFTLCILWHEMGIKEGYLHLAKLLVCFETPTPTATLSHQSKIMIGKEILSVINCVPYISEARKDPSHTMEIDIKGRSHVSTSEQKIKEVDGKDTCMSLDEVLQRKEEEIQNLRLLLQRHGIDPDVDPAQLPQKKQKRSSDDKTSNSGGEGDAI